MIEEVFESRYFCVERHDARPNHARFDPGALVEHRPDGERVRWGLLELRPCPRRRSVVILVRGRFAAWIGQRANALMWRWEEYRAAVRDEEGRA